MKFFLNITHGFQARMLLRSAIAEYLLEQGDELVICAPNSDEPYFREEFAHKQITLQKMPKRFGRIERQTMQLRQFILMNPKLGETLNFKQETLKQEKPFRYYLSRFLNAGFGRITALRRAYMLAERTLFRGTEFDAILRKHQPDLVVTGTPGFNPFDIHLLRSAKRHKIPTATVMLSWDNLTSKGFMNSFPDNLLVWSDLMRQEAVDYHDYPLAQTHWTGAAQFDQYAGYAEQFDAQTFREQHNVPANAKLIVHGTINPAIYPDEPRLVAELANRLDQIDEPTYLWIRLHPQVVKGPFKKSLAPYQALVNDRVFVETPPVQSDSLDWDLPKSDTTHLASLLAAADIVVTTSSTLSIDAACLNRPIINAFFDADNTVPANKSAKRFAHYTHYAKLINTNGIAAAHSADQFQQHVERYLRDPQADANLRQAMIEQQLNCLDGQAGLRTAKKLRELAGVG